MSRYFLKTITSLCCLTSIAAGQQPPNPTQGPLEQAEAAGRRAKKEFEAGIVTAKPDNPPHINVKFFMPASIADLRPYRNLLKQRNTGVVRLFKESDCLIQDKGEVVLNSVCPQLMLPGNGAYYSFRRPRYSSKYLSDVGFVAGMFVADGLFEQGIMVDLGNEDIEKVHVDHDAARSLKAFKTAGSTDMANVLNLELESGVIIDNRIFKRSLPVRAERTYLARFIAFKGAGHGGGVSDEVTKMLNGDSRGDIIVVFRVIAIETDGSVTMIWKQLVRRTSSVLELSLNEKNGHQK